MILNSLARKITGHQSINQGISFTNLFNQEVIDKINESHGVDFLELLQISEILVNGSTVIIRGIKLIADTIIHGYALHRLFGWSIHPFGH